MNKSFLPKLLPFLSIVTVGTLLISCTDDKYDMNELDLTLGVGSSEGLTLPSSSLKDVKIDDILELKEGDCVSMLDNGDYVFKQESSEINPTNVSVNEITLSSPSVQELSFDLNIPTLPSLKRKAISQNLTLDQSSDIQTFSYETDLPDDVKSLQEVDIDPMDVALTVTFPTALKTLTSKIDELSITLPQFMEISTKVECEKKEGNTFLFRNVPTDHNFTPKFTINSVFFGEDPQGYGKLCVEQDKIKLDGTVHMGIKSNVTISTENPEILTILGTTASINTSLDIKEFVIVGATGTFDPVINMEELGSTQINNVPDFLKEDGSVIDLYNPQIHINLESNMDITGYVEGKIYAYDKDGKETCEPVVVTGIVIRPNTTSKVCICRNEKDINKEDGVQYIEVPNLSDIIKEIPDKIEFKDVTARADDSKTATIELSHNYEIRPSYWVEAPVAFAEEASIAYTKNFDGWNEDIEELDLSKDAYIEITANVNNKIPAFLVVEAEPLNAQGKKINDLAVVVESNIKASDGENTVTSPLKIKVIQKADKALRKLDGLKLYIRLKAKDGSQSVTGKTLNGKKHSVSATDIKVKVIGTIVYDAN